MSPKVQTADLFSGAGGLTLASHNVGCKTVFAVEMNKHAATTFRQNFVQNRGDDVTLYEASVLDLDPETLAAEHFANKSCDLVLGGPPCQGFSTHRINGAGIDDPRNALILRYFDFVRALRPKAFLMENVPGILWPRHARWLREFREAAEEAGYRLYAPAKLDAKDYGVPQRRQRVLFLGVRADLQTDGLVWPPQQTHGEGLLPWVACESVFDPTREDDPNDVHMNHAPEIVEALRRTPINGGSRKDSGRVLACHRNHDGHKDVYGRIDPKKPAPTMTTACINPSKGRFVHPTEPHGITARQAARIQTFPDDFVFHGGLTAAGAQIGNAVPVKFGEALLRPIVAWMGDLHDH